MAKTDFKSVDDYIPSQPEANQTVLELVRSTIRKALPKVEETISYPVPAYKLPGGTVIFSRSGKTTTRSTSLVINSSRSSETNLSRIR